MIAALLAALVVAIGSAPPPAACVTVSLPVVVDLDNTRHAHLIAHERAAVDAGQPRILHLDRQDADAHRAASLKGVPTWSELPVARRKQIDPDHWQLQHDRDEAGCHSSEPPGSSRRSSATNPRSGPTTGPDHRWHLSYSRCPEPYTTARHERATPGLTPSREGTGPGPACSVALVPSLRGVARRAAV